MKTWLIIVLLLTTASAYAAPVATDIPSFPGAEAIPGTFMITMGQR